MFLQGPLCLANGRRSGYGVIGGVKKYPGLCEGVEDNRLSALGDNVRMAEMFPSERYHGMAAFNLEQNDRAHCHHSRTTLHSKRTVTSSLQTVRSLPNDLQNSAKTHHSRSGTATPSFNRNFKSVATNFKKYPFSSLSLSYYEASPELCPAEARSCMLYDQITPNPCVGQIFCLHPLKVQDHPAFHRSCELGTWHQHSGGGKG